MARPLTRIQPIRVNVAPDVPEQTQLRALVVSCELELRKGLVRTLESLKTDVVVCGRVVQAEEVLSGVPFDVVFCDEHLPDGSYADLIHADRRQKVTPVIVTTTHGDWELYFSALSRGAFDVIRCPCRPTDVEMALIRVSREGEATVE